MQTEPEDARRPPQWGPYVRAGSRSSGGNLFLTGEDVDAIKTYAGELPETLTELMETAEDGEPGGVEYATALLKVVSNVTDVSVLRYTLTMIDDLVDLLEPEVVQERVAFFRPGGVSSAPARVTPLIRCLKSASDPYVIQKASRAAGFLLSVNPIDVSAAQEFMRWAHDSIREFGSTGPSSTVSAPTPSSGAGVSPPYDASPSLPAGSSVISAVSAFQIVSRNAALGPMALECHLIEAFVPLLTASNAQLLYESGFSLWMLSLSDEAAVVMDRTGVVHNLASVCTLDLPIKVTRVAVAALLNVSKCKDCHETALATIAETSLPSVLDQILEDSSDVKDPELLANAAELSELLSHSLRVLTSMERYEREVEGGMLRWSAVHTVEFWRENARKFEARNFALIRQLVDVLDSTSDSVTLAVACYDIGEFARHHPHGRLIAQKLHLKEKVMALLRREDEELKRQALLCCSKLMVTKWQFVTGK